MVNIEKISFEPLFYLKSKHLQTIIPSYISPGRAPLSLPKLINIGEGDQLSCEISTPPHWDPTQKTVVLVHGLGGSHQSSYMIRLSRIFFEKGIKVVRINLRGCGSGVGLSKKPYCAGVSQDILKVIQSLKNKFQPSKIILMGFSLGGNIILKLAGELGAKAVDYLDQFISVCAPVNLADTVQEIEKSKHFLYHKYYLNRLIEQGKQWTSQKVNSLYEFDDLITAPTWGFKGAQDYYSHCSSLQFLSKIQHTTRILYALDDPFINIEQVKKLNLSSDVKVYSTNYGGHMGFIGKTEKRFKNYWLDQLLFNWVINEKNVNHI